MLQVFKDLRLDLATLLDFFHPYLNIFYFVIYLVLQYFAVGLILSYFNVDLFKNVKFVICVEYSVFKFFNLFRRSDTILFDLIY